MQVPVVTVSLASRPVSYLESSLAIQVKAVQGLPSTFAPVPVRAMVLLRHMVTSWVTRSRVRHDAVVASPSINHPAQALSAINYGAPTRAKSR
jgi:hypothetical protein